MADMATKTIWKTPPSICKSSVSNLEKPKPSIMMDWNWEGMLVADCALGAYQNHRPAMTAVQGDKRTYRPNSVRDCLCDLEKEDEPRLRIHKRFLHLAPLPLVGLNASAIVPHALNGLASHLQR